MTAVEIRYDGTDITALCSISETTFTGRANGTPGECTVIIRDLAQVQTFVAGKTLELYLDGSREWDGYLFTKSYRYWFEGHTANCQPCDHLTPRRIELHGVDRNVLFTRRVLFDQSDPTRTDRIYPAGTDDSELIDFWVTNYLDPTDGIDYSTKVDTVASPDPYSEIDLPGPSNYFGDFMRELSQATAAVFYIDPDRFLQYHDVNSVTAPFTITDNPAVGEVGCRELTILNRADEMVNDSLVWGAGQGKDHIVFARSTDATSVADHKRWQKGVFKFNLWQQASANRIAETTVYGSPDSHRGHKDDTVAVEFVIFTPGVRVADKVNFRSDVYGFEDVIPVREMTISFPAGPENVQYQIRLSHELDEPWTTVEYWRPKREIGVPRCPTISCQVPLTATDFSATFGGSNTVDDTVFPASSFVSQNRIVEESSDDPVPHFWRFWNGEPDIGVGTQGLVVVSGDYYTEPGIFSRWGIYYEDKVYHGGAFRRPTGVVDEGPGVVSFSSGYRSFTAPVNPDHPGLGMTIHIKGRISLTGVQGNRPQYPDVDGFETGLITYPLPDHRVTLSVLRPGMSVIHPSLINGFPSAGKPSWGLREVGSVIWEGLVEAGPANYDQYAGPNPDGAYANVDTYVNVADGQPWALSLQVTELVNTMPIVWEGQNYFGAVALFELEEGPFRYYAHVPTGAAVGVDVPCYEIPVCGPACMPAIYEGPNLSGAGEKYRLTVAYVHGSLTVSVDGIQLRWGIDFLETNPWAGEFLLTVDRTAYPGEPYACFDGGGFALGSALPVTGAFFIPPVVATISGTFGAQTSTWPALVWHGTYFEHFHNGVDFAVGVGTPVYAAADGYVLYEDQDAGGTMISIYHETGLRTVYAHLSARLVPNGSTVTQGQLIALSGASGNVTGPHLHWGMVFAGSPENPLPYCTLPAPADGVPPITYG